MSRQAELNVIHPALAEDGESVLILDQTRLPHHAVQVRGALLIGVTAAYGVALRLRHDESNSQLKRVIDLLAAPVRRR